MLTEFSLKNVMFGNPLCTGSRAKVKGGIENLPLRIFNLTDFIQQVFVDGLPGARLMPYSPCKGEEGIALALKAKTWVG